MPEARLERADRCNEGRQFPLQSCHLYSESKPPLSVESRYKNLYYERQATRVWCQMRTRLLRAFALIVGADQ